MNLVTPDTPLEEITALMARDGYVLMQNALTADEVEDLSAAYENQLQQCPVDERTERIEVPRILEQDARFERLMDHAPVFSVVRAILGYDIELASGGELDHKLPHTPSHIGWHNDFVWMSNIPYPRQNFWLRCTYFISDVSAECGPFTLLPGSHRKDHACPYDRDAQPEIIEGQLRISGPAGSCLISNTEIWHANSPNLSNQPRELIMVLYKHSWMKQWQDGYQISNDFAERQTDPLRRQLCGLYPWHKSRENFPAGEWQPGYRDEGVLEMAESH